MYIYKIFISVLVSTFGSLSILSVFLNLGNAYVSGSL